MEGIDTPSTMTQDVPAKSHGSSDLHQQEEIREMLEVEVYFEDILSFSVDDEESDEQAVLTVANNTTA